MDPSSSLNLVAIPVIDVDGTFFIQGGIFVLLIFILNPLLFKPWLEAQSRRKDAIDGALAKSKTLRADADALAKDFETGLEEARDKAHHERASKRREVETETASRLAEARDEALDKLAADRKRIADEADEARGALGGRVDELADQIANKLLGRAS